MADNPYAKYLTQGAPQADPVIAVDPFRVQDQQIQAQNAQNDATRTQIAVQAENRQQSNAALDAEKTRAEIRKINADLSNDDPVEKQRKTAQSLLVSAGVDLARGIDPVSDLIRNSTSGGLQSAAANAYGFVTGDATSGMENIAKLQTIASDMTLQLTGGSLGNQISNSDRDFIMQRVGNLADPSVPADQRLAAWEQVKQRMANLTGARTLEDGNAQLTAALKAGKSREEILALAKQLNLSVDMGALDRNLESRDKGGATAAFIPGNDNPPPPSSPSGGGGNVMFKGIPGLEGDYSPSSLMRGVAQSAGDIVEGAASIPGMVINPIGQALYDALGYDQRYDTGQIVREGMGLPRNPDGLVRSVNEFGAAALTGSLAARGVAAATNPSTVNALAQTIGRTPIRDAVAGVGAGAGSYAGERVGGPVGQTVGLLAGGLAAGGVANVAATARAARVPNALMQAATRQGVDMLPADVGGPATRALTTGAKASPFSVAPIVKQAQRSQEQLGQAAARVADSQGSRVATDAAGQGVREAAQRFTKETSARGARLYDRAQEAARGVAIKPLQTIAKLDEYIARVKADPSAPPSAVSDLESFRNNIAGGVKVSGLRDARTRLAQGVYDGKLRSGSEQAMWSDILGNLSNDIENGLRSVGRADAATMFKRADAFWKGRVEHIDQVLQPIIGKDGMKGGEQVVQAIEGMARGGQGGNARLARLLANMTDEESGQLRAVLIDRIGRASPGQQTAEGGAFSAATFLTNWNRMTPQAKASLFGSSALRSNLDDIARIAEGSKAGQSMANHSNTAIGIGANIGIQGPLAYAHPVGAILGAGAQFLSGKLLASPGFARLLATAAKMPPEAANRRFTEQLGVLATREPLIANDVRSVQQFLSEGLAQSPTRAAAQGEQENNGR